MFRVPKELISRFVKLCPTCQVRRGASRNSPPESEKSPEATLETQSPETISTATSRKNPTMNGSLVNNSLPFQTAGFKSSSTFQQQNRWMTPLQPPQTETHHVSAAPTSTHINNHESYSTMPPMPLNCTNANPPGLTFPSVNTFGNVTATSSAYSTASIAQTAHAHVPTGPPYGLKIETHYI